MKKNETVQRIITVVLLVIAIWSLYFTYLQLRIKSPDLASDLRIYTAKELETYNGTDSAKPILLAYEGNVYDISSGYEFYGKGGPYHFLAGTDATTMLHIAGGGIVQKKYRIVGRLAI